MTEKIIIAGAGGQGIMLLGKVLAAAAMKEKKRLTWIPSYGAEVRGGTAHCMVVVSDTEIGSPYIEKADTSIIMNNPSLEKFKNRINYKGLLIVNSSLVGEYSNKNINLIKHPFTDIAVELGNIKVANMVALGCFVSQKNLVSLNSVLTVISEIAPKEKRHLIEVNKKALEKGARLK